MSNLKRISFILLFILLLLTMIDDLSKQPNITENEFKVIDPEINIAHVKIEPGDTVLSITEEINNLDHLNIEKIISDFERLNPGTTVDSLSPNSFYYFPLYNEP